MNKVVDKRQKQSTTVSAALYKARQSSGMTDKEICMKCEISSSHLYYVLHGVNEPCFYSTIRLLAAFNTNITAFFQGLALSENMTLDKAKAGTTHSLNSLVEEIITNSELSGKAVFGVLFKRFRENYKMTQKQVCDITAYSIRNIQKIENEEQDPKLMTALTMVCAVANQANIDIAVFFDTYQKIIEKLPA